MTDTHADIDGMVDSPLILYWSSASENTHRFVGKLPFEARRIPLSPSDPMPIVDRPFVLVIPTYCGDDGKGAVPRQAIRLLNDPAVRALMRGVIAGGNANFGRYFAHAGRVVSAKCGVPFLDLFEVMGTPADVSRITRKVEDLWKA